MPPAAALNIVKRLRKQSVRTLWSMEGVYSEFLDVPLWYLHSTNDLAPEHWTQERMMVKAQETGADMTRTLN
jgi:hypothetical protein